MKQAGEHHWSSVVKGDDRGEYVLIGEEAERVKEIHSRLEHLTSDKLVTNSIGCFQSESGWDYQHETHIAERASDTKLYKIPVLKFGDNWLNN